jgi:hypothetical protein
MGRSRKKTKPPCVGSDRLGSAGFYNVPLSPEVRSAKVEAAVGRLMRRGCVVFGAEVTGGPRGMWVIDYKDPIAADELLARAGVA